MAKRQAARSRATRLLVLALSLVVPTLAAPSSRAEIACIVMPPGPSTGAVTAMLELDERENHDRLVAAGAKLFRYVIADGSLREVPVGETGAIGTLRYVPGGTVLVGATGGLFLFDPSGRAATRRISEVPVLAIIERPDGRLILIGDGSAAIFNPKAQPELVEFHPAMAAKRIRASGFLQDGSVLVGTDAGLFRWPASSPSQPLAQGKINAIHIMKNGDALIGRGDDVPNSAEPGLLRYSAETGQVSEVRDVQTGYVAVTLNLSEDVVLLGAREGLFLYDARRPVSLDRQVPATKLGEVMALVPATALGRPPSVLVGSNEGLFLYNPAHRSIESAADVAKTGLVFGLHDLRNGQYLVLGWNGLFLFDLKQKRLFETGTAATGDVSEVQLLPDSGALIASANGLFVAPGKPLAQAEVRSAMTAQSLPVLKTPIQVSVTFEHPCAMASTRMSLALVALREGSEVPSAPGNAPPTSSKATLTGPILFDKPGLWSIQLRRGDALVGQEPVKILASDPVAAPSMFALLVQAWPTVLACISALSVGLFVVLLFLSHHSMAAFRLLTDPVWASWLLTWPFFVLRNVPAVQRWVLEPWFQEMRRTLRKVEYLDPPITAEGGESLAASELLPKLRDAPKLWLQGRSGMGKSSVFAAWERAYFGASDCPTLSAAVRRFGFVLVPLRVRHYAALSMEPSRPDAWVVEAVRRHFEGVGLGELAPAHVGAILKRGHIALAFDGMNEADVEGALAAFGGQSGQPGPFRQVRVVVTSQTRGGEPWQIWELPPDVASLRKGLLVLWLGPEKGAVLDRRVVAEGLSDEIISGYDVRLVADLAGADPEHAFLPANRIALYRAMLARVMDSTGEALRLDTLSKLAWDMSVSNRPNRREISAADIATLGNNALKALTREGVRVIRPMGALYEFRHDQMRAFLAALWLIEELPGTAAMQEAMEKANVFALSRRDQEEVWRFFVAMLKTDEQLKSLWRFASEKPDTRYMMVDALQEEADRRDVTLVRQSRRKKRVERAPGSAEQP